MHSHLARASVYGRSLSIRVQRAIGVDIRMMATGAQERPVAASIRRKLDEALKPVTLNIVNESHKHAGHSGNPTGAADAETHFRLEVVSEEFTGKNLVKRHQLIYGLLADELNSGLHALSLSTKTPEEMS